MPLKHPLAITLMLTMMLSCSQSVEHGQKVEVELETAETSESENFNYQGIKIKKSQLGEITIGMTISEAEQNFSGLRKEAAGATSFGFGGGSPAYLYYDKNELVFGLIPALGSDTVLFIIALSNKLRSINGLSPNSSVKAISERYPDIQVSQDLMNGWEHISDTVNNWDFVFMTDEKTVGEYPALDLPSELKNRSIKANWITVK